MRTKKTVLVYRNDILPISETFIKEQMSALTEWHAILVGRKLLSQLSTDGLDLRIIGAQKNSLLHRLLWKARRTLGIVPLSVRENLRSEQPRLVHAHFGTDALDAWPLARKLGIPMLVTLHGYDINIHRAWWESGMAGWRMRNYPRRLLKLSQHPDVHFVAVSKAIRQTAIDFGIPAEKIEVGYIGIDTRKFKPGDTPLAKREPRVLFVGRLVEKKGCKYLIEAMAMVHQNVPSAHLIVIGTGPLQLELKELAQARGVSADFCGARSDIWIRQELEKARVFCLPSVTAKNGDAEGFGIVLLEAQAAGVPVVTSARGGAKEGVLEGITGFSFPEGDVDELAAILTHILQGLSGMSSDRARTFVTAEFDIHDAVKRLEKTYERVSSIRKH